MARGLCKERIFLYVCNRSLIRGISKYVQKLYSVHSHWNWLQIGTWSPQGHSAPSVLRQHWIYGSNFHLRDFHLRAHYHSNYECLDKVLVCIQYFVSPIYSVILVSMQCAPIHTEHGLIHFISSIMNSWHQNRYLVVKLHTYNCHTILSNSKTD